MRFEEFTKKITELLQEQMGDEYKLRITNVVKNNNVHLTGIIMRRKTGNISPTIYLEQMYKNFESGSSLQDIVGEIMNIYYDNMKQSELDMEFFSHFEEVRNRIYIKLVHYEKNIEQLANQPHIAWNDLAITFYYVMDEEMFGNASITIRGEHMKMWGETEQSLYQIALKNTKRDRPEILVPMKELLEEMTGHELGDEYDIPMYVLTNKEKLFGAAAVLYSEQLDLLAERLKCDLLILPSSVHEILLVPDEEGLDYAFFRQIVNDVNTTQVEAEEVLSFALYRYVREKKEVEVILSN